MGSRSGNERKRQRGPSRSVEGSASPGDVVAQVSAATATAGAGAAAAATSRSFSSGCPSAPTSSPTRSSQSPSLSLNSESDLATDSSEQVRSYPKSGNECFHGHLNFNLGRRSTLQRGAKDKVYAERLVLRELHEGSNDRECGRKEDIAGDDDGEGVPGRARNDDFENDGSRISTRGRILAAGTEMNENEENVTSSLNIAHRSKRRKISKEECSFANTPKGILVGEFGKSCDNNNGGKPATSHNSKSKRKKQTLTSTSATTKKGKKKGNRIKCPNWPFSMDSTLSVGVSVAMSGSEFRGKSEEMTAGKDTQSDRDKPSLESGNKSSAAENHLPLNNLHGLKGKNASGDTTSSKNCGILMKKGDSGESTTNNQPIPNCSPSAPSSTDQSLPNTDALPETSPSTPDGSQLDRGVRFGIRPEITSTKSIEFGRKGDTFVENDCGNDSNSPLNSDETRYLHCNSSKERDSAVEEPPTTGPNSPLTSPCDLPATNANNSAKAQFKASPELPSSGENHQHLHPKTTLPKPKIFETSASIEPILTNNFQSPPKALKSIKQTATAKIKSIQSTTPSKTWTCKRCTLSNQSKRRTKCEACGTPRNLALSPDGSLALADNVDCNKMRNRSVKWNSVVDVEDRKNVKTRATDEDAEIGEDREDSPSQTSNGLGIYNAILSNGSYAKPDSSSVSSSSRDSIQIVAANTDVVDLFSAMIDAPVSTRSRSRSKHNAPPAMENFLQQAPSQKHLNEGNSESSSQPSELQQWLQKRHKVKTNKKRQKRIATAKDAVEIKVIPRVDGVFVTLECLEKRGRFHSSNSCLNFAGKDPAGRLELPTAILPRRVFVGIQGYQGLDPRCSGQSLHKGKVDEIASDQNESHRSSHDHNGPIENGELTAIRKPAAARKDFSIGSASTSCSDRASSPDSSTQGDHASRVEGSNYISMTRHRQTSPTRTTSQLINLGGTIWTDLCLSESSSASDVQLTGSLNACSFEAEPFLTTSGLVKVTRIWVAGKSVGRNDLVAKLVLPTTDRSPTNKHENHTMNISSYNSESSPKVISSRDTLLVNVAREHSVELGEKDALSSRCEDTTRVCDNEKQCFVRKLNRDIDDCPDGENNPAHNKRIVQRELGGCSGTFVCDINANKVEETEDWSLRSIPEQIRTRFIIDETNAAEKASVQTENPESVWFDASIIPMTQPLPNFDYFSQQSIGVSPKPISEPTNKRTPYDKTKVLDVFSKTEQLIPQNSFQLTHTDLEFDPTHNGCNFIDGSFGSKKCNEDTGKEIPKAMEKSVSVGTPNLVNYNASPSYQPDESSCAQFEIGFQTAGTGKKIHVSEEELAKAGKLFLEREPPNLSMRANVQDSIQGIETNGSEKEVESIKNRISWSEVKPKEKCITELKRSSEIDSLNLFEGSLLCPHTQEDFNKLKFDQPNDSSTVHCAKSMKLDNDRSLAKPAESSSASTKIRLLLSAGSGKVNPQERINRSPSSPFDRSGASLSMANVGFQSAGSGKTIVVSDENLALAGRLLAERSSAKETSVSMKDCGVTVSKDVTKSTEKRSLDAEKVADKGALSTKNKSSASLIGASDMKCRSMRVGFQSAGSGKNIEVSDEDLCRAVKLFGDDTRVSNPTLESLSSSSIHDVKNAGSERMIIEVSEGQTADAGNILDETSLPNKEQVPNVFFDGSSVSYPMLVHNGFQSAGSGKAIEISDEDLARVGKLFTERGSLNPNSAERLDNAGSDKSRVLSARQGSACPANMLDVNPQERINRSPSSPFDRSGASLSMANVGFQSAGSGKTIEVSDENLALAGRLLAERSSAKETSVSMKDCGVTVSKDVTKSTEKRSLDAEKVADEDALSTKNKSSASLIGASDMKCRSMRVGFQSAGSGKNIEVSDEDLCRAVKLFGDDMRVSNPTLESLSSSSIHDVKNFYSVKSVEVTEGTSQVQDKCCSEAFVTPDRRCLSNFYLVNAATILNGGSSSETSHAQITSIVTSEKEIQNDSSKSLWVGTSSSESGLPFASPLCASNRLTPILKRICNCEQNTESSMKSRRLFISSAARDDRKITLQELARIEGKPSSLADYVFDVTCSINSTNATKLRFKREDGMPMFLIGQRVAPKGEFVGSVGEIESWLISQDFDPSLFCTKWVLNHYRWIVWKLAAMERRFPQSLGGRYLTYQHVLAQLRTRYEMELQCSKRPAIRKMLNKDVSPSTMTILCVSQVLRFKSKQQDGKTLTEVRLELTDGWYSLPAAVDSFLLRLIERRKIKVGSKLMICNAQLVGADDGVDPLDECYDSSKRNCLVLLKINSNNTRLARWDARLGFVSPKYNHHLGGTFLVKSLRDVIPDGGTIPAIDLVVCRKYPKLYLEHVRDSDQNILESLHLTEAEEAERLSKHEARYQLANEKYAEEARMYCAKELDEEAPEEWKKMVASSSPEDFYQQLGETEKINLDSWKDKRATLLHERVMKTIRDSLNEDSKNQRSSVPYIRLLVTSFSNFYYTDENASAELVFWKVSEQVESLLKEGSVLRMKKLTAKRGRLDEIILTAGPETHVEPLPHAPTYQQLMLTGYKKRVPNSLVSINIEAKRIDASREIRDFDVVACIVKVSRVSRNKSIAYLTDESGLVLKLFKDHKEHVMDPFSLGAARTAHVVAAFLDIKISSFDTSEQCAVGIWTLSTCKSNRLMQGRCEELQAWCKSPQGIKCCCATLNRIDSMIPLCIEPFMEKKACIGYILHLSEAQYRITGSGGATSYIVLIDCGDDVMVKASITSQSLIDAVLLCNTQSESTSVEERLSLPLILDFLRNNQVLFYFLLHEKQSYGGNLSMFEITQLHHANIDAIVKIHSSTHN